VKITCENIFSLAVKYENIFSQRRPCAPSIDALPVIFGRCLHAFLAKLKNAARAKARLVIYEHFQSDAFCCALRPLTTLSPVMRSGRTAR
jgi:hypothetical protein